MPIILNVLGFGYTKHYRHQSPTERVPIPQREPQNLPRLQEKQPKGLSVVPMGNVQQASGCSMN